MKTASIKQNSIRLSLIRLIESGVAGPPNKLFMAFFVGGSQKRHHDLYLLEMQNAKKSMAIKKKIALMSRLGVVRANQDCVEEIRNSPRERFIRFDEFFFVQNFSFLLTKNL